MGSAKPMELKAVELRRRGAMVPPWKNIYKSRNTYVTAYGTHYYLPPLYAFMAYTKISQRRTQEGGGGCQAAAPPCQIKILKTYIF